MKKKYIITATAHLGSSPLVKNDVISYFVDDPSVKHPGVTSCVFSPVKKSLRVIEGRQSAIAIIGILVGHLGRPNLKDKYKFCPDVLKLFGETPPGDEVGTITLLLLEVEVEDGVIHETGETIGHAVLEAAVQFNGEAKVRIKSVDIVQGALTAVG